MSEDEKLKAIRKTSRERMPLRAGRGAGFHGSKGYDRKTTGLEQPILRDTQVA